MVDVSRADQPAPVAGYHGEAFRGLLPVSPHYASLPILNGFNWAGQLDAIDSGQWYLVVFRSVRRPDADVALLTTADDLAHDDARRRPGFLHYFKGTPNDRGECLSFCVWTHQGAAQHAGRQPAHHAAMRLVADMYVSYALERYLLRKAYGGSLTAERVDWQVGYGSTPSDVSHAAGDHPASCPATVHGADAGSG